MSDVDEKRRQFLVDALTYGFFTTTASGLSVPVHAMGEIPKELPPGRSIYMLQGDVIIDDKPATIESAITTNSVVETGGSSHIVFRVGRDAFMLRSNSKVEFSGTRLALASLRLITGKILSVFGKRKKKQRLGLKTAIATIGIRGTGVYMESEPDQSYICTCYGKADLASAADPNSRESVETRYHDSPRYILKDAPKGKAIKQAPVINHTDEELELIESIVGRTVPFAFTGDYDTMRKAKY